MQMTGRTTSFLSTSLYIYIILCGFQNVIHLPVLNEKLQLSELWFIVILSYLGFHWKTFKPVFTELILNKYLLIYGLLILLYLSTILISCCIHFSVDGMLDFIGKVYLVSLQFIFILGFFVYRNSKAQLSIIPAFIHLGMILSLIGLLGWLLSILGIENRTTEIFFEYPYFGNTHRLRAFCPTPSYYISIVSISIACALFEFLFKSKNKTVGYQALFMSLVALLCFSKSYLFIFLICLLFVLFKLKASFKLLGAFCLLILIVQLATTHFIFIPVSQMDRTNILKGPFASGELIYKSSDYVIAASSYYQLKKSAWKLFKEFPYWGIGPANFNQQINLLKEKGYFPDHVPSYDPHATLLGSLAETGLFGFFSLFILGIFYLYAFTGEKNNIDAQVFLLLTLLFVFFAEGLSMDVLNFRHYWIVGSMIIWQRAANSTN